MCHSSTDRGHTTMLRSMLRFFHVMCSGARVAVKVIAKAAAERHGVANRVVSEVSCHSSLTHPYILDLMDFFEDSAHVYLVTPPARGGDLYRFLSAFGPLPLDEVRRCGAQLLSAMAHMHAHGVLHRDLKLSNILLDQKSGFDTVLTSASDIRNFDIKVADYGLAVKFTAGSIEEHRTICGTPNYIAPEVTAALPHGPSADIFSVGCLLYSMMFGRPPFTQELTPELPLSTGDPTSPTYRTVTRRREDFTPNLATLPHTAAELLRQLLESDPQHRPTAAAALHHPFFTASGTATTRPFAVAAAPMTPSSSRTEFLTVSDTGRRGSIQSRLHPHVTRTDATAVSTSPERHASAPPLAPPLSAGNTNGSTGDTQGVRGRGESQPVGSNSASFDMPSSHSSVSVQEPQLSCGTAAVSHSRVGAPQQRTHHSPHAHVGHTAGVRERGSVHGIHEDPHVFSAAALMEAPSIYPALVLRQPVKKPLPSVDSMKRSGSSRGGVGDTATTTARPFNEHSASTTTLSTMATMHSSSSSSTRITGLVSTTTHQSVRQTAGSSFISQTSALTAFRQCAQLRPEEATWQDPESFYVPRIRSPVSTDTGGSTASSPVPPDNVHSLDAQTTLAPTSHSSKHMPSLSMDRAAAEKAVHASRTVGHNFDHSNVAARLVAPTTLSNGIGSNSTTVPSTAQVQSERALTRERGGILPAHVVHIEASLNATSVNAHSASLLSTASWSGSSHFRDLPLPTDSFFVNQQATAGVTTHASQHEHDQPPESPYFPPAAAVVQDTSPVTSRPPNTEHYSSFDAVVHSAAALDREFRRQHAARVANSHRIQGERERIRSGRAPGAAAVLDSLLGDAAPAGASSGASMLATPLAHTQVTSSVVPSPRASLAAARQTASSTKSLSASGGKPGLPFIELSFAQHAQVPSLIQCYRKHAAESKAMRVIMHKSGVTYVVTGNDAGEGDEISQVRPVDAMRVAGEEIRITRQSRTSALANAVAGTSMHPAEQYNRMTLPRTYHALYMNLAAAVLAVRAKLPRLAILTPQTVACLMDDGPLHTLVFSCRPLPHTHTGDAGGSSEVSVATAPRSGTWRAQYSMRKQQMVISGPGYAECLVYSHPPGYVRAVATGTGGDGSVTVGWGGAAPRLSSTSDTMRVYLSSDELSEPARSFHSCVLQHVGQCINIDGKLGRVEGASSSPLPFVVRQLRNSLDPHVHMRLFSKLHAGEAGSSQSASEPGGESVPLVAGVVSRVRNESLALHSDHNTTRKLQAAASTSSASPVGGVVTHVNVALEDPMCVSLLAACAPSVARAYRNGVATHFADGVVIVLGEDGAGLLVGRPHGNAEPPMDPFGYLVAVVVYCGTRYHLEECSVYSGGNESPNSTPTMTGTCNNESNRHERATPSLHPALRLRLAHARSYLQRMHVDS